MAVFWEAVAMPNKTQTTVRIRKLGRAVAMSVANGWVKAWRLS